MTKTRKPAFEPNQFPNPFYESILALRAKDPKTFASLSPATKASLLAYEKQKR